MPGRSRRLKRVGVGRRAFVGLLSLGAMAALSSSAQALHWVSTGPRGGGVSSLATVEGDSGALWAAAEGVGLWRSVDAGVSWQPVPTPQSSTDFGVVTDPSDPRVLYSEGPGGVAKTLDGGASWKVVSSVSVGGFAIAPSAPATLYLASQRVGVGQDSTLSRSDDGGATWRLLDLPPQPPGESWSVYELDVDPADSNRVFAPASIVDVDGVPVLLRSTDGGSSWTSIGRLADLGFIAKITFDRSGSGVLYGLIPQGPVRSHDQGATWEHAAAGLPAYGGFTDLVFDPASGALLLAASGAFEQPVGQIWRSTDGGSSWTKVLERSAPIQPLALDRAHPGRLYAGAEDVGLLVSTDSGQHWQVANPGFLPMRAGNLIADLRAPGTLYAQVSSQFGPHLTPSFPPGQFARTQDGGATWETWMPRNDDGTDFSFGAKLIADPFAAGSLYSAYFSEFFSQSVDGGRTWHTNGRLPAGFSGIFAMIADPFRAGVLLVLSESNSSVGNVVLRSADAGKSWTKVLNLGTGTHFLEGLFAEGLFADPASGALYAGGQGGFWRSLNGGRTWTFRSLGRSARGQTVVRLQTDSSHNLYVQTSAGPGQHSLYRGTGQGGTFMPIDGGLPAGLLVTDLAASPQRSPLYLGSGDGVYVSRDRGTHWMAAKEGLISLFIYELAIEPAGGGTVYAVTPSCLVILQQP
ncbi:MAG TPA: hypothetical protein VF173_35800 [Thermoanaerobaculia bacterium]|nr:hypothetical protein [Thermoanaerobaculia bacterium]